MRIKLEREIGSVPVTNNAIPGTIIEAQAGDVRHIYAAFEPAPGAAGVAHPDAAE